MEKFELLYKSAIELKSLISKKELSAIELTKLALERIEDTNHKTNAFITVTENLALESAKLVDKKIQNKEHIGLLGGVPTSIKDLEKTWIDTRNMIINKLYHEHNVSMIKIGDICGISRQMVHYICKGRKA